MKTNKLSFLFTFRDKVSGNGFLANIEAVGRLLAVQEEEETWWMNGVQPGGIAEGGKNPEEAYAKFRETYRAALFDIALEEADFNGFKSQVENFFNDVCSQTQIEWWDAVEQVKKEKDKYIGLPIKSADETKVKIIVEKVEKFKPSDNILVEAPQALAA